MTNAFTIYGQFDEMQRAAIALYESGYFTDSKSKAQAIVKVMAGAELGIPPFAAMTGIHIIQGKPALGANVLATLIKNDPRYNYRVLVMDDDVCKIEFYENGEPCGVSEFTSQDAQKAGVKNMQKFPRNMLFARAISNGAKWYCPGIFGGAPVYTPDELGADVDEDGNVVAIQHDNGRYQTAPEIDDGEYTEQPAPVANGNDSKPAAKKQTASGGIDWKSRAMGKTFPAFASCIVNMGIGYNSESHVENALGVLGEEFNQHDTDRLWDALIAHKQAA